MKQEEKNKKIENTLNSLNGLQRATPGHFFFTRVLARLQKNKKDIWETMGGLLARPIITIAGIILIIALNAIVIFQITSAPTNSVADQNDQSVADEYNFAVTAIYDNNENPEPQ
ncbi:MAG: hypothetical protein M3O67_06475 [Bacteroidota bacterium]|nr:hypothetical protein [Bacteroidota bacterium]